MVSTSGQPALQALRDAEDRWIQARRIWNQHADYVTNVREDSTIPQQPVNNWESLNMAAYTRGQRLCEIPVRDVMSTDLQTSGATDSVGTVEAKMKDKRVRRIPVVDGSSKPIGMVSLNDLARTAVRSAPSRAEDVDRVADTLAVICEPRNNAAHAA